jgi:hypothetical protein
MKNLSFLFLLFIFVVSANSQVVKQTFKVPSTYDRSSITVVVLDFPDGNHSSTLREKIGRIVFADKYYNNNVEYLTLNSPFGRNDLTIKPADLIKKAIEDKKMANEIVSKWYSRKSDGSMSLELIHERGMFNATDDASLLAKTTKRGNAELEDYGNRLINRSYILVFDFQNLVTAAEAKIAGTRGWQSNVVSYLYKIDYSTEVQAKVYDAWIYNDDTPQVKADKKNKFEQIQFPISFVASSAASVTAQQMINRSDFLKVLDPDKSEDQLLLQLVQKAYDENLYSLDRKYEDFRVKTTIDQTSPITAKIGKKEGLKTDYRFFAYEYVYNESAKSTSQKLRGVIRSTANIVDNRQVATGKSGTTQFYQTAGKQLEVGYLLQQRNDIGGELSLGYEVGGIGGVYGRLDLRLGRYAGIPSFFVYVEGGAENENYFLGGADRKGISFVHFGGGIAKGIMLTRNLEIRPYAGVGIESASHDDFKNLTWITGETCEGLSNLYGKGGANLSINIMHNIQFTGGCGYYSFLGTPKNGNGKESTNIKKWSDIFAGRNGGLSVLIGIKFGF